MSKSLLLYNSLKKHKNYDNEEAGEIELFVFIKMFDEEQEEVL